MKFKKLIPIFLLTIAFILATLVVWAFRAHQPKKAAPREKLMSKKIKQVYDSVLVHKFEQLAESLNLKGEFTYSGILSVNDGSDTAASVNNMPFLCSRKGNDCYNRFGKTETMNAQGVYLFIEHDQKKVWLSPQKQVTATPMLNPALFKTDIAAEDYALTSEKTGSVVTISLTNEHHLTCKKYALSYDTTDDRVTRILARLTNLSDPLNDAKDKVLDIHIFSWINKADISKYLRFKDVVTANGDTVKLTQKYRDYELLSIK